MMEVKYTDNLLVYIEVEPTGKMATVSAELLTKGRFLAEQLGCQLHAVAIGASVQHLAADVFAYGASVFCVCEDDRLTAYTTAPYAVLLEHVIKNTKPQVVLIGSTAVGRDLAPRVAAALQTGLTANCIDLQIDSNSGNLLQIRPAFGDNLMATIVTPTCKPQIATVRAGVFAAVTLAEAVSGEIALYDTTKVLADADFVVKVLEQRLLSVQNGIDKAQIVVAGGYGVGSQKNFKLLYQLAELLHGEVGGTRAAVDAGWISHDKMIGQTGITVRPKLYIACGISGQVQHITGMQDSDIIVSINTDADAPINKIADYVIQGRVEDVVPVLIQTIERRKK